MPERAYIAIGSNLGDRRAYLEAGLKEVASLPNTRLAEVSHAYETPPMGPVAQPDFLNAVFAIKTSLAPVSLLEALLAAEKKHQRQRPIHWGPRTLDLDLLLYGEYIFKSATLTLPHPHMHERSFVLVPLCEIAPRLCHPVTGRPFAEYLATLNCREAKAVGSLALPAIP
ncbi:MAG: 2-amino-4-hydroxy-6-hydroxymethyldihydropteridine diphosphokinase [Gemmatimonadetes bacterium]|nr:2-amino-4-hydroxy-6-hydroxymethyldihydropteridine diphosphokinase [Gemmatimonadota bacterium]MXY83906.1 2-amino-4-hydroxy-6-hydroxymethyldihydropteridine diphosphokinase [Gemmatimonadota bacterium]MYB70508.1 2-amino-4-hydroxy-6-hydroxymethyldihydropteridine diphosphokinase [Gemmatimonadota bacterium]